MAKKLKYPDDYPRYEDFRAWIRRIHDREPSQLSNLLALDLYDPDVALELARMAGEEGIAVKLRAWIEGDDGRAMIAERARYKRVVPSITPFSFLELALEADDRDTARWVLSLPAIDVNAPINQEGRTIFEMIANSGNKMGDDLAWAEELYTILLRRGAGFHRVVQNDFQNTLLLNHIAQEYIFALPLIRAAARLNEEAEGERQEKPYHFDSQDKVGKTALRMAVVADAEMVTQALLEAGANPNLPDRDGATPLHCACARGNPRVVAMLIRHGADVFAQDGQGRAPFDYLHNEPRLRAILQEVNINPDRPFGAPCNPGDWVALERAQRMAEHARISIRKFDPPKASRNISGYPLFLHALEAHDEVAGLMVEGAIRRKVDELLTEHPRFDKIMLLALRDAIRPALCHTHSSAVLFRRIWNEGYVSGAAPLI